MLPVRTLPTVMNIALRRRPAARTRSVSARPGRGLSAVSTTGVLVGTVSNEYQISICTVTLLGLATTRDCVGAHHRTLGPLSWRLGNWSASRYHVFTWT